MNNLLKASPKDLGNGFVDYGVAAPISNHRGMAAGVDADGKNVLMVLMMDHRGGYEMLVIDTSSGKTQEFPVPFQGTGESVDSPYASIFSSKGKFYTHFNSNFLEFDPKKPGFTFVKKTTPQMAMSVTEDDRGVVWSVTYPQSGLASFDPKTQEFHDFGELYKQNWNEYPRSIACDEAGWVYFAVGSTASQIVAFDPSTGHATPLLKENERQKGAAYVYRDQDGNVYGQALKAASGSWIQLHKGIATAQPNHVPKVKVVHAGDQNFEYGVWPDGSKLKSCDLVNRTFSVIDGKSKSEKKFTFDYTSEGAIVMGLARASDHMIAGGTTFPMRCFWLDTKSGELSNRIAYGQWNIVTPDQDHFYVGGYPGGFLLDWQPAKPWVNTEKAKNDTNPAFYRDCDPVLHRPTCLLATADHKTLILGGTPQYGYTGGGLLFWDRASGKNELIDDAHLIPDQSTQSLIELPNGKLFGGTTTAPGTGGEKKANQAELFLLDRTSRKIEWHSAVLPAVQEYTQLCNAPDGLVYGIADQTIFFVFDPAAKAIVYQRNTADDLGSTAYQQGPRIFVKDDHSRAFLLFHKAIVEIEKGIHRLKKIADSPIKIESGGDFLDGKIYFISGSHICSYQLH